MSSMTVYDIFTVKDGKKIEVKSDGPYFGSYLDKESAEIFRQSLSNKENCWIEASSVMG